MRQTLKGTCMLCHGEFSKQNMTRHLEVCRQRTAAETPSEAQHPTHKTSMFHLVVEGERSPMYWLHLDVPTTMTLATLDRFLRDIWLECCGHLSAFTIDRVHYCEDEELFDGVGWHARKQPLQIALEDVLHPGQICAYEYDFGSTTALRLKVVAALDGEAQGEAVRMLARNVVPPIPCDECGKEPAISACRQCIDEDEDRGYLCEACAQTHACDKELLVRLRRVNSPRVGVCGYAGPTNPAYV